MINQDAELESFKREIDLRQFAVSLASRTGRSDLIFKTRLPADEGEDWNQLLQNAELDQTGLAK